MSSLTTFLKSDMHGLLQTIYFNGLFLRAFEASNLYIILTNLRSISDMVNEALPTPKKLEAHRAVNMLVNISSPNVKRTMFGKHV